MENRKVFIDIKITFVARGKKSISLWQYLIILYSKKQIFRLNTLLQICLILNYFDNPGQ